jgi:hypothetical protein
MEAYSRQFSFDNSSVNKVENYAGSVSSLGDIKRSWILGAQNPTTHEFIYSKMIGPGLTQKSIKSMVNTFKSIGQ